MERKRVNEKQQPSPAQTVLARAPKILILGTGTVAYPFAVLLQKALPAGSQTYIAKKDPRSENIGRINRLRELDDVDFVVWKEAKEAFEKTSFLGTTYQPDSTVEEIAAEANLIMDCTGADNKSWFDELLSKRGSDTLLGIAVEGSVKGIGQYYMHGVTDTVLDLRKERKLQIPSCNTHCLTSIIWALSDYGKEIDRIQQVVCFIDRRNQDKGKAGDAVHTLTYEPLKDPVFGTHQAKDAYKVLELALGEKMPKGLQMVSHAQKSPQPFMHATYFSIIVDADLDSGTVHDRLRAFPFIAFTDYMAMGQIYEEYCLQGLSSRGYDYAVVLRNQTQVLDGPGKLKTILLSTLTPQEGNVIISNLSCALKFLYPAAYASIVEDLIERHHLLFGIV